MSWAIGSPSINPETADIIVYRDGDYAVAVETRTRQIIAKSTNHAEVINRAILDGKDIYLNGEFSIEETIVIKNSESQGTTLRGTKATKLKLLTDGIPILSITSSEGIIPIRATINNIHFDLSGITSGYGIEISSVNDVKIINCSFGTLGKGNIDGYSIHVVSGEVIWIVNNAFSGMRRAVSIDSGGAIYVVNNFIEFAGELGIISSAHDTFIIGNSIDAPGYNPDLTASSWATGSAGIRVASEGIRNIVAYNRITGAYWHSIEFYASTLTSYYSKVIANICRDWSEKSLTPQGAGIRLTNVSYADILYNTVINHPYGVDEGTTAGGSNSDYNRIIGNKLIGCTTPIRLTGANDLVKTNEGYVTENSGKATFSGDGTTTQFTIAHGLVSTPSKVVVTPASADASGSFYVTADATNIYVNYSTAPPAGTANVILYWWAEV